MSLTDNFRRLLQPEYSEGGTPSVLFRWSRQVQAITGDSPEKKFEGTGERPGF